MKLGTIARLVLVVGAAGLGLSLGCSKSRDSTAAAKGSSSTTSGTTASSAAPPSAIRVTLCAYAAGADREKMGAMVGPLQRGLVQRLAQPAEVALKVLATQDQAVDELASGGVDLCPLDPARYLTARQKRRDVTVLVAEAEGGRKVVDGAVVVKKESRLQKRIDSRSEIRKGCSDGMPFSTRCWASGSTRRI